LLAVPEAEVVAVPVSSDDDELSLGRGGAALLDRLGVDLFALLDRAGTPARTGDVVELPVLDGSPLQQVLLIGVGAREPADFRRAGASLARRVKGRDVVATDICDLADEAGLSAFVEGVVLGSFAFSRRTGEPAPEPVRRVVLTEAASGRETALRRGLAMARAGWLSRTLALTPGNEKSPQWLAQRAQEAAASAGLTVRVWGENALAKEGFGGILAVGQGSPRPSCLIQLDYRPKRPARGRPRVVLVGKGITFDTGGLSLKPGEAMMTMKRDMTGGGVVIAAMGALAELGIDLPVTGLVAAAENSISGAAQRPGDVITHYGGRTSEVLNTDAEGRLVLADALAYAAAHLRPDVLVDVATLTGAVKVALGQRTGGLYSDDDTLASALAAAGRAAGEPLWRLPLVEDYLPQLESSIADANNAPRGAAGSITAALFLRPFAAGIPWAHLDVASAGDSPVDAFEWTAGATGFGVRALLHWLSGPHPRFAADEPTRPKNSGL
jgi:leucyl aminopeptidase